MTLKQILTAENTFPLLIIVLGIANITMQVFDLNLPSFILSIIGITGACLYFVKNKWYKTLILVWILGQMIVLTQRRYDNELKDWKYSLRWDLTQIIHFKIGSESGNPSNQTGFHLNVACIAYLFFLKVLRTNALKESILNLRQLKSNSDFAEIFPLNGKVLRKATLSLEENWLLLELDKSFLLDDQMVHYALIKPKDGGVLQVAGKNQIVFFRAVPDIKQLHPGNNEASKFPFLDWAFCG